MLPISGEETVREGTNSASARCGKSGPPMLPPSTCDSECRARPVGHLYRELRMTNPSLGPEEQRPPKPIRIILPREVCTTPEAAKIMHEEHQKALKTLRGGSDSTPDPPRA
jgi:hypothetical protein